jgi:PAS domain S-box-containing protein
VSTTEERLERALAAAGVGTWHWDLVSNERVWSDITAALFGLPPGTNPTYEQFLGMVHPHDRHRVDVAVRRAIAEGSEYDIDYRALWPDGSEHWIGARGRGHRDATGRPVRAEGVLHDITARKREERLLQLEHAVTRCLAEADTAAGGVKAVLRAVCKTEHWDCGRYFCLDERAGLLRFGEGWCVPGNDTEAFIKGSVGFTYACGTGLTGLVWQSGEPLWVEDVARDSRVAQAALSRASGMRGAFVFPVVAEGHTIGVISISSRRVREPDERLLRTVRVIGSQVGQFVRRKEAEEAVKEWKDRYEAIIQASGHLLYDRDARTDSATYGGNIESMLGYSATELAGTVDNWVRILHPEDVSRFKSALEHALASKRPLHLEYRLRRKDDRYIVVQDDGYWILDPAREIVRAVGFVVDVTERKRADEERIRLEAQLRQSQKMQALGTLAGGIAHDFNNLLLAIAGNARLAAADLAADHHAQPSLVEIDKACVRASDLVRRILAFGRQEEPKRRVLNLQAEVEDALKLLRATLPAMIEIRTRFALDAPEVLADATQIHQIMMNLGANAAYAIGERGGLIEITLGAVAVTSELAQAYPDLHQGRYVRLTVRDDGCGMDKATLDRVFEPFFTTKAPGQGVGLGLSVVHGIMQNHGGAITADSEPGKGTAFHLYFPVAVGEAAAEPGPIPGEVVRANGERVLFVDDEEALAFLAVRTLQRLGYRVTAYTDPLRALEAFRSQPGEFDVVVTDLSMPGMSGVDLARVLLEVRPDLPILMTSGYVRAEDVESARRLGIRAVVLKPNTVEELGDTLHTLLAAAKTHSSTS